MWVPLVPTFMNVRPEVGRRAGSGVEFVAERLVGWLVGMTVMWELSIHSCFNRMIPNLTFFEKCSFHLFPSITNLGCLGFQVNHTKTSYVGIILPCPSITNLGCLGFQVFL